MFRHSRQALFYSIVIIFLVSILYAPGGLVAQASFPLAPLAPGHNIYFQAVGLPDGVSFTISGTRVNNGSHPTPYTTSFTTPDSSGAINADPESTFTYNGYPESLVVDDQYFELDYIYPTSPFTVGVSGGFTYVIASYEASCLPPTISDEPISQTVQYGDPVTFTVSATGSPPLSYEWYKDDSLIVGADQDTYSILSVVMSDAGLYHAVVSNACGSDTSSQVELTVNKLDQTIFFEPPDSPVVYGSTFWVTPTASSGLEVSLNVSGSCTNDGFQVSMVSGTGECVLTASQPGDDIYNPAADVEHVVEAMKADQAIDFTAPASPVAYGGSFDLEATASSGLEVSFAVDGVCELAGNTVTMTSGTGSCTITASQGGDKNYNPATDVEHTVEAMKADQVINFTAPASPVAYGGSFELEASVSSGLDVSFAVDGVCELAGNAVTMTSGTGSCTITASQGGDENYNPATDVEHTVEAMKADQVIDFTAPASPVVYGGSFELEASVSSGLDVSFAVDGVCELAGNTVTMTSGTGSCTITASQAGNSNYNSATPVNRTVQAAKVGQSILFPQPSSPVKYKTSFIVSPTSSSGLPVSLTASGSCTNSGYTVTITEISGACVLTASQPGDLNYLPAESVQHTIYAAPNGNVIYIPLLLVVGG